MPQQKIKFEQFFAAPRDRVFAFFADHEKFGRIWGGRFKRVRDGQDPRDPNGLGSIREVSSKGMTFEETIVTYTPPSLIEYTVTKGGPIKNHLGHIEFREVQGGTKVEYTITFDPRIPLTGGILASVLCASWHAGVNRAVEELARAA
jgi:uncharacterized protein YndB with AHSA1/START domain